MQKEYQLAVDIEKKILTPSFEVNTLDLKTIKLKITITKGMTLVDLTDITVRMSIRKPDGNVIFQDCQVTNAKSGQVEIVLENQAYVMPGSYSAEIMCFKGTEKVAVTGSFSYRSIRGIMDDKAVESKSEFTAITGMIKDTQKTIEDLRENGTGIDAQARQEVEQVSAQLADISINVKQFGATGDGLTDDTQYIQAAINHVQQTQGRGKIYIPKGIYKISKKLSINFDNLTIEGESRANSILYCESRTETTQFPMIQIGDLSKNVFADNTVIRNIGFKSDGKHSFGFGIVVSQGKDVTISNIRAEGMSYPIKCSSSSVTKNVTIENSLFVECYVPIYSNVDYTKVLNCTAINTGTKERLERVGESQPDSGHGPFVYLGSTDNEALKKGMQVLGCVVENGENAGIKVSGCELTASNNVFENTLHGVVATNNCYLTLSNNIVKNTKSDPDQAGFKINGSRAIIKDNIITDVKSNGVFLNYCTDSIISGNLVGNLTSSGIQTQGIVIAGASLNIVVESNVFKGSTNPLATNQYGISIREANSAIPRQIKIINNIFEDSATHTAVLSYGENVEIVGNTFKSTDSNLYFKTSGISLIGNSGIVRNNRFYLPNGRNVYLSGNINQDTLLIENNEYMVQNYHFKYDIDKGKKITKSATAPISGAWKVGDEVINTSPSRGGYMGFVCVEAGTPGVWKGYGLIEV